MATLRFFLSNSFANLSTTGVFPVPPTVKLPTTTTKQSSGLLCRMIRLVYKNNLTLTTPEKIIENGLRKSPNKRAETERSRS